MPIEELLVESDAALSIPVMKRAQLLRIMKTVVAILERSKQKSIRRMAQFLVEQLLEAMPELQEIGPWPAVGQRRTSKDLGQAAFRRLSLRRASSPTMNQLSRRLSETSRTPIIRHIRPCRMSQSPAKDHDRHVGVQIRIVFHAEIGFRVQGDLLMDADSLFATQLLEIRDGKEPHIGGVVPMKTVNGIDPRGAPSLTNSERNFL